MQTLQIDNLSGEGETMTTHAEALTFAKQLRDELPPGSWFRLDAIIEALTPRPIPVQGERMTADQVNALPDPLRRYIHDLETRADPAGEVQTNYELRQLLSAAEALVKDCQAENADYEAMIAALDRNNRPG